MRTRIAKYKDLSAVCRYLTAMHERTGWDFVPINPKVLRESVVNMIRTQHLVDVLVAEDDDGNVRGVLLASVDRFFWSKAHYASDVHFIADGGGASLLTAFKDWAHRRQCTCIVMAVATDDPRAEMFLEAGGFERRGGAMVCFLTDRPEEKAA
jgi:hypothetical protein